MHLFLHLALAGGDGVEAGSERAQQAQQLFGCERGWEAFEHIHHLGAGHQGVDLGLVTGQIFEGCVVRDLCQAGDKAAVQAGQLQLAAEHLAQAAASGGLVAGEMSQRQDLTDQVGIVVKPDAQRIPRLIVDAGLFEADLDVADILGRVATGDLLVDREPGREGVLLAVLAVADRLLYRVGHAAAGRAGREGGGDGVERLFAPCLGGILIIHVQAGEFMHPVGAGLGQQAVKVLAGLAEKFIGAVTQSQHGELEPFQLADLALLELLVQIDRALRRFTLPVSAHYHQQVGLFLELLGFVVRHGGEGYRQATGLGLRLDGTGHALGVAGLGAVENGQIAAGGCGGCPGHGRLAARLGETVEITAHPGKLLGVEGR